MIRVQETFLNQDYSSYQQLSYTEIYIKIEITKNFSYYTLILSSLFIYSRYYKQKLKACFEFSRLVNTNIQSFANVANVCPTGIINMLGFGPLLSVFIQSFFVLLKLALLGDEGIED